MTDPILIRNRWKFLAQWSGLNLLGWAIGICILMRLEGIITGSTPYYLFPFIFIIILYAIFGAILGASIGIFQWFMLRKFGIKILVWISVTALGYCIGSIFFHICNLVSGVTIIGIPQSIIIRKHVSRSALWWIGAHIFGAVLSLICGFVVIWGLLSLDDRIREFHSPVKRALVALLPENLAFQIIYWFSGGIWFFWLLLILLILGIAILTGMVLLKQSKPDSVTKQAG
jgi:hypothetical protein